MQYVHRIPLVYRRMFATSISSKSRGKGDQTPKSSFAERFGSPSQSQAQDSQTSFPTWPGLQPTHTSPYVNPLSLRPPPSNLIAPENAAADESKQTTSASRTRRYQQTVKHTQTSNKQRELFSDCIGNASSFVNTSSFEAKVAMEPAAHTFNRWMVAAKNNIERFKTLPEPVEHTFESSISSTDPEDFVNPSVSSTISHDSLLESSPKSFSRTSRNPAVVPSSRRMLSTSTTDASVYSSLLSQAGNHIGAAETKKPLVRPYFWKICAVWVLAAVSEIHPRSQPTMSGVMRRLCEAARYPSPFPNPSLSFFQPAFHPSLLVLSRGYATARKRVLKRRAYNKRDTTQAHRGERKPASIRKQRIDEVARPNPQPQKKLPFIHEVSPHANTPYILIPAPANQTELCNALRYLIQSTEPPPSLPRLIVTHTQCPTLQTAESYNVLLAHASRVAPVPYSSRIISQLRTSGVIWNKRTEQLVVRAHIQSRQWEEAIVLAEKLWMDGTTSRTPLDIFAELLHFVLTKKTTVEDTAKMADRCWKLFPTGATVDVIGRSPRIAYNIVRILVNTGRREQALQLSRKLLDSLESPTPANIRHCRSILFHVIRPPRGNPSAHLFVERRQLFDSLLQQNRSLGLTPDPELTCALLQNLRKRRNRGSIAFHTLLELRAKYGPQVENSAVRRIITRYAIGEENFDLARDMLKRENLARLESSKRSRSSRLEAGAPWVGQDHLPTQSHLEYLRKKGTENRKFTLTARSLRRREQKLGRRERTHPESILAAEERARRWESIRPGRKQRIIRRVVSLTGGSNNEEKGT
ncbi:unnamed protein product [Rhizoctonia solani]|uniref:Uncharacterized protein n=1 Tax=Rhizoctonia solani TaxID=456999 RepID=A0A8H2XQD2_9AGAM|nr:unnamed protein product [Rhizoctonia solani]